jgi:hypothetical protein
MKGYFYLHAVNGNSIQVYFVEIRTTQLIPVSPPVVNPKYALYTSPLFIVKKITVMNKKFETNQVSEINGSYSVNGGMQNLNLHFNLGDSVVDSPIQIRCLYAFKYCFGLNNSKWRKTLYNDGNIKKSLWNENELIKTIYQIGDTRVKILHLQNLTKYIDQTNKVVAKFPYIITHKIENNFDLSCIQSIKFSLNNGFRSFEKIYTKNCNVAMKWVRKNYKKHGLSIIPIVSFVDEGSTINVWRRGVLISHSKTDILKEIEYFINRKKAVVLF